MHQCFDCAPDPNVERLFSIAVNILEELKRGFAFGTFVGDQLGGAIKAFLMCFNQLSRR